MKISKAVDVFVSILLLITMAACSAATETPAISEFPRLQTPAYSSETEGSPVNDSERSLRTPAPPENFEPDRFAPIQLSLTYMASAVIEETRLYKIAMEFMRRHPDVYIDLKYTKLEPNTDGSSFIKNTTKDIINGNSSDIVMLNTFYSMRSISASGNLANIGELIDSDTSIRRSDFFENTLDGLTFGEDLFIMPISFYISPYSMNKEYSKLLDKPFEEYESIDFMTMMEVYERMIAQKTDSDMTYLSNLNNNARFFNLALGLESLDYENRTANIYNDEMHQLLEKVINLPLVSGGQLAKTNYDDFFFNPQVDMLFADINAAGGTLIDNYLMYEESKYTKPIPCSDTNGEVIYYLHEAAIISKNCSEPDTAWAFLKFFMGFEESHEESGFKLTDYYQAYPVQKELFREYVWEVLENHYERNLREKHVPPYPKDEAIERAVVEIEKDMSFATKYGQMNELEFGTVWETHYYDCVYNGAPLAETLKTLESDINKYLAQH